MTGLLICAAVVAFAGAALLAGSGVALERGDRTGSHLIACVSLALIAVALWLAYAAGGASHTGDTT